MKRPLVVALDQGGSRSRALAFDDALQVVARAQVEVATTRRGDDEVEQDGEELVQSLRRALRDLRKQLGSRANDVVAAGLATQRSSCAAWDRDSGGVVAPVLSWQDRRAASRVAALSEHAGRVRGITGLPLSPHYGATKLAWIANTSMRARALLADGRLALGPLSSFLLARLCDERPCIADASNAQRTQLLSLETGCFDPWLCDIFGVPLAALPKVVGTRHAHGTLDFSGRKVPLVACMGDQGAALWADGEPSPDECVVVFGTGAFLQRFCATRPPAAGALLEGLVARRGDEAPAWSLEGTVNGAGSALAWALEELELGEQSFDLDALLAEVEAPPLFLNGVGGLGSPWWRPAFESRWIGAGDARARLAAVVESVVFMACENLELLSARGPLDRVRVAGGLSMLDGACQRLADLSRARIWRGAEVEGTARGLARVLFDGRAKESAPKGRWFEPREHPALVERRAAWRAAMAAALA